MYLTTLWSRKGAHTVSVLASAISFSRAYTTRVKYENCVHLMAMKVRDYQYLHKKLGFMRRQHETMEAALSSCCVSSPMMWDMFWCISQVFYKLITLYNRHIFLWLWFILAIQTNPPWCVVDLRLNSLYPIDLCTR